MLRDDTILIIDGALATELESRGCDISDELWSATILIERPHIIQQIHHDYFEAGADIAITASYQASVLGLAKYRGLNSQQSCELLKRSVELAQQARSDVLKSQPGREMLVAGSIGPYGAFLADGSEYRGNYDNISSMAMKDFHRTRIKTLLDAGVDLLACETMPSFNEIKNLVEMLQIEFPVAQAWISCTLRDESHLSDGTPLIDVCAFLNNVDQVIAIGVNCIAVHKVSPALKTLASLTRKPLLAYPNSGEAWNATERHWEGFRVEDQSLQHLVAEWKDIGATLIGGCCRTTPKNIRQIHDCLRTNLK